MHRLLLISLLIFTASLPVELYGQQKNVTIRIVQEDLVVTPEKELTTVTLERESFRIQVLLQNIKGVYAFASTSDSLYRLGDDLPIPGFGNLPEMTMAEENYNREKELLISNEGWCYWFYDPSMAFHRFNKKIIVLDNGRVVGAKTIKQLYFLPERRTIRLKEVNVPIYLLFVAVAEEDEKGNPVRELLRRKLKIEWRDED